MVSVSKTETRLQDRVFSLFQSMGIMYLLSKAIKLLNNLYGLRIQGKHKNR
jgi:hypothetical protein